MILRIIVISLLVLGMLSTKAETDSILIEKNVPSRIRLIQKFEREHHQTFTLNPTDPKVGIFEKDYYYVPQEQLDIEL